MVTHALVSRLLQSPGHQFAQLDIECKPEAVNARLPAPPASKQLGDPPSQGFADGRSPSQRHSQAL